MITGRLGYNVHPHRRKPAVYWLSIALKDGWFHPIGQPRCLGGLNFFLYMCVCVYACVYIDIYVYIIYIQFEYLRACDNL